MNDLLDDPQLRHIELNKINVLTDKSLDLASELCNSENREWYGVIDNIDIINDKIDLVNEIGEVIDNYIADAYNIVDGINKSHDNDSLYDILAENLKKCKDTVLKMINSSNVWVKQDTNNNKPDKQETKNDKLDTKKKYTKKKNTKKKDTKKKDPKKEDKPNNIKKYNDKKLKTFSTIENIINLFVCEKLMNESYYEKVDKDKIVFYLIHKPIKGVKIKHMVEISREIITLAIEKKPRTMNRVVTICIIDNQIKLNISQNENVNKHDMFIKISNDEIVCNISSITGQYLKDISEVFNCSSNIRYTLLKNIIIILLKYVIKKMKLIRKKRSDLTAIISFRESKYCKISKAWVG